MIRTCCTHEAKVCSAHSRGFTQLLPDTLLPRRMRIAEQLHTSRIRAHPDFCVMERFSRVSMTSSFLWHSIKSLAGKHIALIYFPTGDFFVCQYFFIYLYFFFIENPRPRTSLTRLTTIRLSGSISWTIFSIRGSSRLEITLNTICVCLHR